jgi:hypothetical protein
VDAPVVAAEPEIVSKSAFARLSNVTPGRVSQWLSEKKIHGDAIIGEGRDAQIHVARARVQLRLHLDIGQRMGNGLSTQLDGPAPIAPATAAPVANDPGPTAQVLPFARLVPPEPVRDPIEEQIKRERLETARRTNRKMAQEEAASAGRYVLADDARKEVGKSVAQVLSSTDGWIADVTSKISAKFALPQRDVLHLMRSEFRNFRATLASSLRQQAENLPEMVEDELSEVEPGEEFS